ncbi:lipoprotein, putative, partial [Vibrio cholerae O1 str. EC-0051]
MKWFL